MKHIHFVEVKIRIVRDIPVASLIGEQQFGPEVWDFLELKEKIQVYVGIIGKGVFIAGGVQRRWFPVPPHAEDRLHIKGVFFQPYRPLPGQNQGVVVCGALASLQLLETEENSMATSLAPLISKIE